MTFLELQNQVLDWLDDDNAGYFTRPKIKRYINNAQKELQKKLIQANSTWYLTCARTSTILDVDCISLPSDFLKMHKLELITSGTSFNEVKTKLDACTPLEADMVPIGPGTPSCYYLKKDCIVLRSIPDRAYPLQALYSYRVSEMTSDSQTPDCPDQYAEFIAVLATLDGFLRDQRDPSAFLTTKKADYEALMGQDAAQRQIDGPRMVVMTEGGEGGYIL